MARRLSLVAGTLACLATVGCAAQPNDSGNTSVACRPLTVTSVRRAPGWSGTVFTVVMENHDGGQILGNPAAPYINGLAQANAIAAGYHGPYVHPSRPNYLWMVAGENFGALDDADPSATTTIAARGHIADQIEQAGLSWRAYQETMGQPCGLASHALYAAKHDPFVYFTNVNGWNGSAFAPTSRCADHIVDYAQLEKDLASGSTPDYVFITPNLVNDMHNGTVADGDAWAARELPKLLASDAYKQGGVLFLLWDEGSNDGDNPPFIVVSPSAKHGYASPTTYDTSSYLLTVQALLGLDALPCGAHPSSAVPMSDLFAQPLPSPVVSADAGPVP